VELRCEGNKLHGLVIEEDDVKPQGIVEFRCDSRWCGANPGLVVLHRFNLDTGEIHTKKYREPPKPKKG
jgi:hypothetical protein